MIYKEHVVSTAEFRNNRKPMDKILKWQTFTYKKSRYVDRFLGNLKTKSSLKRHCCCYSVTCSCPTLHDPVNYNTPGFPVFHNLPEFAQMHVCWVNDAIQTSRPLSPPSLALNPSQHQGLFQWVRSSHQVTRVLELQLQHQSLQWIFRVNFL